MRGAGSIVAVLLLAACAGEPATELVTTTAADAAPVTTDGTSAPVVPTESTEAPRRPPPLDAVEHWLYFIDVDLAEDTLEQIVRSEHDMVVLDFIPSEEHNTGFPMAATVQRLHDAPVPKLVLAYIDIGQAEDFRAYWEDEWEPGAPHWIAGLDPDGWEGNYPVAYWYDEWRAIWLDEDGVIDQIAAAGFDGIYLDWIEAYSDPQVIAIAEAEGVDPLAEMVWWVTDLAEAGRAARPGFLVVAQNAAELLTDDEYASVIDGLAQEQVWFDGGADNIPPGDCPLPATEADVDTAAYEASLSEECLQQYREYPESTLHVSSEEYLAQLAVAAERGLPVFTVDYALDPDNRTWVYEMSRSLGFVPFVGSRALDRFEPAFP